MSNYDENGRKFWFYYAGDFENIVATVVVSECEDGVGVYGGLYEDFATPYIEKGYRLAYHQSKGDLETFVLGQNGNDVIGVIFKDVGRNRYRVVLNIKVEDEYLDFYEVYRVITQCLISVDIVSSDIAGGICFGLFNAYLGFFED